MPARRATRLLFWGLIAACFCVPDARGQAVYGTVVDLMGRGIRDVTIQAFDTTGVILDATVTQPDGAFRLRWSGRVDAVDLSFRHVSHHPLDARIGTSEAQIEVVMEPAPIMLPEVSIEQRLALSMQNVRAGFAERMETNGWGAFVGPDDQAWRAAGVQGLARRVPFLIEGSRPPSNNRPIRDSALDGDLLMRAVSGQPCRPTVYIDGNLVVHSSELPIRLPAGIEGVEAYQTLITAPEPYNRVVGFADPLCGAVLFWTSHSNPSRYE